ncbi:hypothetical protein Ddye_016344 [Dipteronia dyeriana]|uniref:Uncharacterized protein n=1 Tax=Dipteronia dyeriana TaxID=168575 RepID=A0AAD9X0D6_9ROSI|nr:hypothetical protein Ddye_016344 [Dipteronia dyeriana]
MSNVPTPSGIVGLEEAVSGIESTLRDVANRLDCVETDFGEITKATKSTIHEFQKSLKEDLTREFRNIRSFVEQELRGYTF